MNLFSMATLRSQLSRSGYFLFRFEDGCEECGCERNGTIGRLGICDLIDGQCACKPHVGDTSDSDRTCSACKVGRKPHLNRDKIETNLSVTEIQWRHEKALIKSFEMSPYLICF